MGNKELGGDSKEIVSEKKIFFILNTVRISGSNHTSPIFIPARAYFLRTSSNSTLKDPDDIILKISWLVFFILVHFLGGVYTF